MIFLYCLHFRHDDTEHKDDHIILKVVPILDGALPHVVKQLTNVSAEGRLNITVNLGKLPVDDFHLRILYE